MFDKFRSKQETSSLKKNEGKIPPEKKKMIILSCDYIFHCKYCAVVISLIRKCRSAPSPIISGIFIVCK